MQGIADKIRHYRKTFRPPVLYALTSSALWLSVLLASIIVGLIFFDLYVRIAGHGEFLNSGDQALLLLSETVMIGGILQTHLLGTEKRFRRLNPTVSRINIRTPQTFVKREKIACIRKVFNHQEDLQALAKRLVEEWEWRQEIKLRSKDPLWVRAIGFFTLPNPSNFAAYMTGLIAVLAAIIITTLTPEALFGSVATLLSDIWANIRLLTIVVVLPVSLCILPAAVILTSLKEIWVALLERLNDQYLSQAGFYRFISQLLELHDQGEPLLLRKTQAWAYWSIRLGTAPIQDLRRVGKRIRRGIYLAKRLSNRG
ncbi:hypothetical protein SAMN03159444_01917 [Pseudomonas sp. NFACC02]|uniref:hypothetical protein n=1 Tax=Pseudomonas sp. NFACC02 TaxID=1566250 RepID=UPI0008C087CF|nr:hypothetical protein [Pseudomonas sp. NFACC02]SEQ55027.1 hypothetical protein SAMN03159444_01917 [Pseudomonas sp. NFACC02]